MSLELLLLTDLDSNFLNFYFINVNISKYLTDYYTSSDK